MLPRAERAKQNRAIIGKVWIALPFEMKRKSMPQKVGQNGSSIQPRLGENSRGSVVGHQAGISLNGGL
jgi:hypothetical protein